MKHVYLAMLVMIIVLSDSLNAQKFDGIALTPPMGWNTFNTFAGNFK